MMIYLCPHCGHNLPNGGLSDGIAFCAICQSSIDSSQYNRIMSAAWMFLRQNPESFARIAKAVKLTETETILVESFMFNEGFSIDEFRVALKELGIQK
jgi:hypothetical protein